MCKKAMMVLIPAAIFAVMLAGTFRAASRPVPPVQEKESGGRNVSDGVYTAAQANRGRTQYESTCVPCHGVDLSGAGARPLAGEPFMRAWRGFKLNSLFERAQAMPPGAEGSLGDQAYVDVISYVLEVNEFPTGPQELTTEVLEDIQIGEEGEPLPVENFSMVQITGCLMRSPDNAWVVSSAPEPVRTRDPEPSKDQEFEEVAARELGTQAFRLMFVYPSPDAYEKHKVEVKGLLIMGPEDSINVSSLQSLDATFEGCASLP